MDKKRCKVCCKSKPLSEFYLRRDNQLYRGECKSCKIEQSLDSYNSRKKHGKS